MEQQLRCFERDLVRLIFQKTRFLCHTVPNPSPCRMSLNLFWERYERDETCWENFFDDGGSERRGRLERASRQIAYFRSYVAEDWNVRQIDR